MSSKTTKPTSSKTGLTVAVIIIGIAAVAGVRYYQGVKQSEKAEQSAVPARTIGKADAPIKIIEFIDLECPACAQGAKYLKELLKTHSDLIYLEMKYFPLTNVHRHALTSARYTECAAHQGKFWPLLDYMLERQADWKGSVDPIPVFDIMAEVVDLDEEILDDCLEDPRTLKTIQNDQAEGQALGVRSTPTYFINNDVVVGYIELQKKINELIPQFKK